MRSHKSRFRAYTWCYALTFLCVVLVTGCANGNYADAMHRADGVDAVGDVNDVDNSDDAAETDTSLVDLARDALGVSRERLRAAADSLTGPPAYPRSTRDDGTWRTVPPHDWTSGFFPGLLWRMYEHSGDAYWERQARRWTEGLEDQQYNRGTHDLGFMLFNAYGNGYRLTGDTSYVPILLEAARSLASRYDSDVGATKSWDWSDEWDFPVIVDNMMNLELLFWAAEHGGDEQFREIAIQHAITSAEHHVRPDGSTFHVVDFDPETGAVTERTTWQGAAPSSTWSRGQAWGLYGFTMTYRETGDPRFLTVARETADYFIARLPDDSIPHWDFDADRAPETPRDAAAGAIAAAGLLELSRLLDDEPAARRYYDVARNILRSLAQEPYLVKGSETHGILRHATGDRPHDSEVDVSLIYADYYFVEALMRYLEMVEQAE